MQLRTCIHTSYFPLHIGFILFFIFIPGNTDPMSSICFMIFMALKNTCFTCLYFSRDAPFGVMEKQENWWVDYHSYIQKNQSSPFFEKPPKHHLRFFGIFLDPKNKKNIQTRRENRSWMSKENWQFRKWSQIESLFFLPRSSKLGGGFNYFFDFHPYFGEDFQFD